MKFRIHPILLFVFFGGMAGFLFACNNSSDPVTDSGIYSGPIILKIDPIEGKHSTEVTLYGTNFGATAAENTVTFDSVEAQIVESSQTTITVIVPEKLNTGEVSVKVSTIEDASNSHPFTYLPTVTVSTYAGDDTFGYRDGDASSAQFRSPTGLTMGDDGTLYIADRRSHTIRMVTKDGQVETLAGTDDTKGYKDGTGDEALFDTPTDVAINNSGELYVAEFRNNKIRRIDKTGMVTTLAGSTYGHNDGVGENAQFRDPVHITLNDEGVLYVGDMGNNRIRKVTKEGVVSTYAGDGTFGYRNGDRLQARFRGPRGVAEDDNGTLFIADEGNHRFRAVDADGIVSNYAGDGTNGYKDGEADTARFDTASELTVDDNGTLYIADFSNHCIRTVTPDGTVKTLVGDPQNPGYLDGDGAVAKFNNPMGIVVNGEGNVLYVSDTGVIRKITIE